MRPWTTSRSASGKPIAGICRGADGAPTCRKEPGARCARTTPPTVTPGPTSRSSTPPRAPTGGTRTGWRGSATICRPSAWPSRSGTGGTRSSRSGSSASPASRATMARTSRTTGGTWMPPPRPRGCAGATTTRSGNSPTRTCWPRTGRGPASKPSTSCSTPECSTTTGTGWSTAPGPRAARRTSCGASRSRTPAPTRPPSMCCPRCGSATGGHGVRPDPDRPSGWKRPGRSPSRRPTSASGAWRGPVRARRCSARTTPTMPSSTAVRDRPFPRTASPTT